MLFWGDKNLPKSIMIHNLQFQLKGLISTKGIGVYTPFMSLMCTGNIKYMGKARWKWGVHVLPPFWHNKQEGGIKT